MQDYVRTLCHEIKATTRQGALPCNTIYFGGGTPSLVPPELVEEILLTVKECFGVRPDAEITLEADPGTFDIVRLQQYMKLGVNRISMGVQSFEEEHLQACGRSHKVADVYQAVQAVQECQVPTWSLDLISGLPGLTREQWRHTLHEAIRMDPNHISVYDLQVEEGTPFSRWYEQGRMSFPQDDEAASMYSEAVQMLTSAGYEHYEISNYAKPGHRSKHNQVYWKGVPYYAFGLGAASYLNGVRFSRPAKMQQYKSWVLEMSDGVVERGDPPQQSREESLTSSAATANANREDALLDTVMLRLRTSDGLDMGAFSRTYSSDAASVVMQAVQKHKEYGLILQLPLLHDVSTDSNCRTASPPDEGRPCALESTNAHLPPSWNFRIRLSDPEGFLLSNSIISDVFAAFSFDNKT
ncbi:hypothetical protein CEUSTIGMA_g2870.t1 [Chlamydomonas eustigma]|uniref:Radical S-adenosyl methionine domain-containing protein 1, mitochondrial n=1 Tax=Chlamydomonas eustigma TaxID=1157962 RepID=A0A250WXB6_9CHLO|nr:hypothetical protein CEUSTIGMA_g2870.t1 [Chlamydomonas eustigma]|eukprot:GAX75426.1 hypothetical protein CEUSTIGMA_g2870.t1 [Chlamydomonas eustigma]